MLYNYLGQSFNNRGNFYDNMQTGFLYDDNTTTAYYLTRVFKKRIDGSNQYPFIRVNRTKPQTIASNEGWLLVVNGGLGVSAQQPIDGIAIENGVIINNSPASGHAGAVPITIDQNGNFGKASPSATAEDVLAQGINFAVCGFCPIIEDYQDVDLTAYESTIDITEHAQRQIWGQFENGDYAILTCDGRSFNNSVGWTLAEAQTICKKHNIKFAFNMDGGGSTATVIGNKRINPLYDSSGTVERTIPSFLVFNGTDRYFIPSQQ